MKAGVLACTLFVAVASISAQSPQSSPRRGPAATQQACAAATAAPLVLTAAAAAAADDARNQGCDAESLYYGLGHPPDLPAALRCAYYQRAHPDLQRADVLSGAAVLAMIYANGAGVAPDYRLATRFVCENYWAGDADRDLQIAVLRAMPADMSLPAFDLCESSMTTIASHACASIEERRGDDVRARRVAAASRTWSEETRKLFTPLQAAERAFEEARVDGELLWEGTGAPVFAKGEEGRLRDQFVINLERFARSDVPKASASQEQSAERTLASAYVKLQQVPQKDAESAGLRVDGVTKTEDAWLALREAWLAFGRVAYPTLASGRISAELIALRLHQLQSLQGRFGNSMR